MSTTPGSASTDWPALPYEEWAATKKTLQMVAQILGKVRLALEPPQPEWLNACLYLNARGWTTGPLPVGTAIAELAIDIFAGTVEIRLSDGRERSVVIAPHRCVADIYKDVSSSLAELDIVADIWEKPQELPDAIPFSENRLDCALNLAQAQRFFSVLSAVQGVFDEWRSKFFGRTGLQFWWGAFDLGVLRFNGKHATPLQDRGYIMRYDLDAEFMNAGFWPGDDTAPMPGFYAYIHPQPEGCETAPINPSHAGWVEAMGEWLMPYDAVRTCPDPRRAILDFLDSVYAVATSLGGWDAEKYTYTKPAPSARA